MLNGNLNCFESRRVSAGINTKSASRRETGIETCVNHIGKANAGDQVQIFVLSKSRMDCAEENYYQH